MSSLVFFGSQSTSQILPARSRNVEKPTLRGGVSWHATGSLGPEKFTPNLVREPQTVSSVKEGAFLGLLWSQNSIFCKIKLFLPGASLVDNQNNKESSAAFVAELVGYSPANPNTTVSKCGPGKCVPFPSLPGIQPFFCFVLLYRLPQN